MISSEEQKRATIDLGYLLDRIGIKADLLIQKAESWEDWSECPCCVVEDYHDTEV